MFEILSLVMIARTFPPLNLGTRRYSSPEGERICGRTTQLVANSDIPPQRGRLGGVRFVGRVQQLA